MAETADELTMKYSRKELEEMGRGLGFSPSREKYPTKDDLAEAIVRRRQGKEKAVKPTYKAPEFKVEKEVRVKMGKTGVYAKKAAIEAQAREDRDAVAAIDKAINDYRGEMEDEQSRIMDMVMDLQGNIKDFRVSMDSRVKSIFGDVVALQNDIKAQSRENAEAVKKMDSAEKKYQGDIAKEKAHLDSGVKAMHVKIGDLETDMDEKAMEVNAGVRHIQDEILKFQGATSSFIKDFYFG